MIRRPRLAASPFGLRFAPSKTPTSLQRFCAYNTQKQALNALAFLFKHVLGREEPAFNVKLKKTGTRVPVVLSQGETERLFGALETPDPGPDSGVAVAAESGASPADAPKPKKHKARYGLVARLQYGAGLRLSEVVRLTRSRPRARLALRAAWRQSNSRLPPALGCGSRMSISTAAR